MMRTRVLWLVLGLLCYLSGAMVFLTVIFSVWGPEGMTEEGITTGSTLLLALSIVLFGLGGYCSYRGRAGFGAASPLSPFGGAGAPGQDESWSERQRATYGFDFDPREVEASEDESQPTADAEDGTTIRCPHCGSGNESGYRFCANCSKRLSG